MNMKKIILNTLCVLAVTVAAQHAYAQSPSMEAKFLGDAWSRTFTTGDNKKKSQPAPADAGKPAEQPATEQAEQPASNSAYLNAGPKMKIVNGAEYNAHFVGEVYNCIGDACKTAWDAVKNFFVEGAKNIPQGYVPGREGAIMRSGENFWKNIKDKETTAKSDSLAAALDRANVKAAASQYEASQQK
ncbi:MAG: hypothetical protein IJ311_03555 [Elusimicrobiaceae bacterium]|nr:hypothetical protein [Elusimicrobiaceae bacterium]